jgi:hypothetical protein
MDQAKLKTWAAGILIGMPIGLMVAVLVGNTVTIGAGILGSVALNYFGKK